ncbi:serine hydrolase domain-containing protein [Kineococcus sp. LSe6-4]|uniref:Serine hydrolase domain-containing protein n=1 Tax=Kineococcus halophytocola TaxID=3234027 RepID=A0ABV4GYJ9_9ACTN
MSPQHPGVLADLALFSGAPQIDHFGRMAELVTTRAVAPSSHPRPWPEGERVDLPGTFSFAGDEHDVQEFLDETETSAVLVLHEGRVVHERYFRTGGPDVPWLSMSVAKSFVGTLVGIAVAEGAIRDVEDPISDYVPVDPGSAYDGVPIRSVLQMSSGAVWNEDYSDPEADALRLARATSGQEGNLDTVVATLGREREPDTLCRYNSCDTQALASLLRHATGRHLADYLQEKLCEPLGFQHEGAWVVDPSGIEMGFAGLNLVARDYARLGELYRNDGAVDGVQVVPAEWVRAATTSSLPHLEAGRVVVGGGTTPEGYGYQWWLPAGEREEWMAAGVYNQYVYVDPANAVTVVKLSANRKFGTADDESAHHEAQSLELLRAIARSFD